MRKLKTNLEQQSVQSNVLSHRVRSPQSVRVNCPRGGGGALPRRLMGMCSWMGSHFHDFIDYYEVAFFSFKRVTKVGSQSFIQVSIGI